MAAYAAMVSLKHVIDDCLRSSVGVAKFTTIRKYLEFAHCMINYFQFVLKKFNHRSSKRLDPLDRLIRDATHKLEDVLQFHRLNYEDEGDYRMLVTEEELRRGHRDVQEVHREIISFLRIEKEVEVYIKEFLKSVPQEEDDAYVSSDIDSSVEMVGRSAEFTKVLDYLHRRVRPDMCFFSLVGEVGTGGSVIAKNFFEDQKQCFDCSALVTIGTECKQYKEVVIRILEQVQNPVGGNGYELLLSEEDERMIRSYLYKALEHRRYMIVLDDVRSVEVLDYLRSSFPDQSNGSLVFLTTDKQEIAHSAQCLYTWRARAAYFETIGWHFLHWAVFGVDAPISPGFVEAAKKIYQNCRGLGMAHAKTLLHLLKTEKTEEQWRKIAVDKENPIFMVEDELSEICKIKTEVESYNWNMGDKRDVFIFKLISAWIDFSSILTDFKKKMQPKRFFPKLEIISLWGMAGIGKTTLAKKLFQDKSTLSFFDHCVWLSLGPKYQADKILIDILAQIYPSIDEVHMKEDEELVRDLCIQLSNKTCLIVVDDLWSTQPLLHLKKLFPDIKGRALVTSRLAEVSRWGEDDIFVTMRLLDKEESWTLLCKLLFANELCPIKLEKAGQKIAENCEGLPLLLCKVADQLLKVVKDPQHWNDAAFGKRSLVFKNAHDDIYKILFPSYKDLPQHLKACFLYLGVFRKSYEISITKVTSMLAAEGFLEPILDETKEYFVPEFLVGLIAKGVVMAKKWDTYGHNKRCRLHCVFWYLCNAEATKNNFFHAMDSYADCFVDNMKNQRRLCIHNSVLLGFKNVQESMASVASARSFICVSPPHQYPVPIGFGMRLLRVMHALAIRLYEFPVEVVKLLHLRYLALTFNGELPPSISKFQKLQHLILSRSMNTNSSDNASPLPVEIWDMKELKHLQIMGGCLPNPKRGAGLPKLTTLLDMSAESCTQEVLEMIPNLKKLGIRIELEPDDDGNAFHYLNNISCLSGLESLKCVVVNPQLDAAPPPAPVSMFPSSLKRLSLSGLGYPWEHMSIIGKLSNLEVLKLKSYAFQGPRWDLDDPMGFQKLKFLSIEDTDLVYWELPLCSALERLSIKHCYNLEEFPTYLPIDCFRKIEIVHCSPLTVTWAEQMSQKPKSFQMETHLIR